MRIGLIPESLLEGLGLVIGRVPIPFFDTMGALLLSQTVITAVKLGILDEIADRPGSSEDIAAACNLHRPACERLLRALEGSGYLQRSDGVYTLTRMCKRWLTKTSARAFDDGVLHRLVDRLVTDHYETYLLTGEPLRFHSGLSTTQWATYENGQVSHARMIVREIGRRLRLPPTASTLLDIGGGHGLYSRELCTRYPQLHATVLDLPGAIEAVQQTHPRVPARLAFRAGDALVDELGDEVYDVVLLANVVHHFSTTANEQLLKRVARSLKPGGLCAIIDIIRATDNEKPRQLEALFDLYFSAGSSSGTWTQSELARWQRDAGLRPERCRRLLSVPDIGIQVAHRPAILEGA